MNDIERLHAKILDKYPDAKTKLEYFRSGMYWLDVWREKEGSKERKCWSIVEWNRPDASGFGFTDMSGPDDDRHIFQQYMDEYGLDFETVFKKVCDILGRKE